MNVESLKMIDTTFNVVEEAKGGDPDSKSPTLKRYHKLLWSKPLPNGLTFLLSEGNSHRYLVHRSELGTFQMGSDAISHSYKNQKRKSELIKQVQEHAEELFLVGSTVGAYTLFPNNKIDGKNTINMARGVHRYIDDRFDLTLECIRRFYRNEFSPLFETLDRYRDFFSLFERFENYVEFFHLQDLLDNSGRVRFYLPFDDFASPPSFRSAKEYTAYKNRVVEFVMARNDRIKAWSQVHLSS